MAAQACLPSCSHQQHQAALLQNQVGTPSATAASTQQPGTVLHQPGRQHQCWPHAPAYRPRSVPGPHQPCAARLWGAIWCAGRADKPEASGPASIFCEDEADLADGQMFNSNLPVLTDALPFLQRLTSLHLGELWARDAVVTSAQQLPCLRELLLEHSHTTAASFRYLPETLTRLQLNMRFTHEGIFRQGLPPAVREPRLGLLSTPAFLYLTALQHLSVFNTGLVHPVVLYELSALQHLDIDYCSLAATSGEPGLAVFSRFAKLQHLALPGVEEASREVLIASAADVAALTVSSHLTHLSLAPGLLHETQYAQLFPDGRKLPHLVEFSTSMALLACCEAMQRMVGGCATLESITLTNQLVEAVEQSLPGPGSPAGDAHSWQPLQRLKNLKQLDLEPRGQHVSPKAWQCLGRVTQLQHLNLGTVGLECLEGLMQLTQLSRLEDFAVDVEYGYISMDLRGPGEIVAALPGALVELAITVHDDLQAAGHENAPVASECLARVAAAQAALSQQQEKNSQLQQQLQLEVEKLCVSVDEAADMQE